ncbi:MAG: hypothetical protein G8237_03295 [Magnetococcales bacterium]|nr:hypothetical protein [Magnetococcales bacterium]
MKVEQSLDERMDEILSRLQGIWASPIATSRFEFELKRLEREVEEQRRHEPIRAFYLLGLIATLQEEADKMQRHFKNALWHSNQDPDVRHGYGACLARMGHFSAAREQYRILYAQSPDDLNLLAELIMTTLATGRIQEGVRWMSEWSRLNPQRPMEEAVSIAKSSALLERFGVSDDDMERLQQLALNILERGKTTVKTINYTGMPADDPCWIQADLIIEEPTEVVESLNHRLAEARKSATPPRLAELIFFNFCNDHTISTEVKTSSSG